MLTHTKRLHISPLTPESLATILRPPFSDHATDVSFHTLATFPEKAYGFVTLPVAEAERLKKKLHRSVLRGAKMRVEEARTKKSLEEDHRKDDDEQEKHGRRSKRSTKAGGREEGILPGIELEKGRKVRRGWTEPQGGDKKGPKTNNDKKADKQYKNAYKATSITGKEECLFKTKLPPNARDRAKTAKETEGKAKKRKRAVSNGGAVVHEFAKTEKDATFLRDKPDKAGAKTAAQFVDGKGWVDNEGNIVEEGPAKRTRRASKPKVDAEKPEKSQTESDDRDDATSSSGTSSSKGVESDREEDLSVGSQNVESFADSIKPKGLGINSTVERLSITRSSATPPPPSSDEPIPTLKSPELHPLESLFKRPSKAASQTPKEKPTLEVSTSFSFDLDTQDTETRLNIPSTPFTQQDIRSRRQRSAAPTPDTAVPGKTFGNVWGGPESSDVASEDEEDPGEDEAKKLENMKETPPKEGEESEFAKWFYEHRGDNNRAWKRRRRETAKEKRQSENRKRRGD